MGLGGSRDLRLHVGLRRARLLGFRPDLFDLAFGDQPLRAHLCEIGARRIEPRADLILIEARNDLPVLTDAAAGTAGPKCGVAES